MRIVECQDTGRILWREWKCQCAIERSALMVRARMLPVIVGSCLIVGDRDWLIPACGKKTRITRQTEET